MIACYPPLEISQVWSDEFKWSIALRVELSVIDVLVEDGIVPASAKVEVEKRATIDLDSIARYEELLKHDVIAFVQSVSDMIGNNKRWFHLGLTSSDVMDTALSLMMVSAGEKILELCRILMEHIRSKVSLETVSSSKCKRSNFSYAFSEWEIGISNQIRRLNDSINQMRVGKLSGPVGTYPFLTPDQERRALSSLGLMPDLISTQIISRDRHAEYVLTLCFLACYMRNIIEHSSLLTKCNKTLLNQNKSGDTISGDNFLLDKRRSADTICALLRSYAICALSNMAVWHERDISHSSVERIILPETTAGTYYLVQLAIAVTDGIGTHD